jgi:AbrB family looped-hinge helix DNA binding protein
MTALQTHITLAANGRIVIPAAMRAALSLTEGSRIVARVEDGVLVLEPIEAAIRRAQAMAAPYGAAGVSLADELTTDRRAAADRE